ncbi:hypothetical protein AAY473_023092 [Plecturocebus cupreus]
MEVGSGGRQARSALCQGGPMPGAVLVSIWIKLHLLTESSLSTSSSYQHSQKIQFPTQVEE